MTFTFHGFVDDKGQLALDNRQHFKDAIAQMRGAIVLQVRPKREKRSIDQNAYWWAVPVKILSEHTGYTPSQMHYALLGECFGYKPGPFGEAVPNVPSSSDLNTEQFSRLIDWVLVWAPSELEVFIPGPEDSRTHGLMEAAS